ncbi:hypothetical protein C7K25_15025 [Gulosibacter molinativorax]|uniref:Uncharacterized protein n=1 Tax=Gulosibacter molinativorax TaxID=256821 RepID=A0ABT7CBT1_9MICO|nr:hypothetical protein [Gulosibacter molinativorax]QUY62385.1 Hypotetical protein [Gulosibacter molinativorax]
MRFRLTAKDGRYGVAFGFGFPLDCEANFFGSLVDGYIGLGYFNPVFERNASLLGNAALIELGKNFELGSGVLIHPDGKHAIGRTNRATAICHDTPPWCKRPAISG